MKSELWMCACSAVALTVGVVAWEDAKQPSQEWSEDAKAVRFRQYHTRLRATPPKEITTVKPLTFDETIKKLEEK